MAITIDSQIVSSGYDRQTCWVHPRAGAIPTNPPTVVLMMHKLRITGDDVFYPVNTMRTDDGGATWSGPTPHVDAFARRPDGEEEEGVCDWWPAWHAQSGKLLAIGHTVRYVGDNIPLRPRLRSTVYSVYDADANAWSPWQKLTTPHPDKFQMEGAGSVQRYDLSDGTILLPTYYTAPELYGDEPHGSQCQYSATVMRCSFDGQTLRYIEHGSELTILPGRGFTEPSLTRFGDQYFLTLRNNDAGYVARSADGLHFDQPQQWTFDDGSDLGSYNTQQHWVTMPDALYLVYTRRGEDNGNVPRHRAPLFIARVDPQRLCVMRDSEQVLVPNRGARLGNFGVTKISDVESWVTVAEWMQTHGPEYWDVTQCEKYGSDNSVYVVKLRAAD